MTMPWVRFPRLFWWIIGALIILALCVLLKIGGGVSLGPDGFQLTVKQNLIH